MLCISDTHDATQDCTRPIKDSAQAGSSPGRNTTHVRTSLCGMWLTGNTSAWLTVSLLSVSVPAPRGGRLHVNLVQVPLKA